MPREIRDYCFNNLCGCVTQRKNRKTGQLVGVYHAEQSGIDCEPENPWVTVCEAHGRLVSHPTLALAMDHAADPLGWCGDCNGVDPDTSDDERGLIH